LFAQESAARPIIGSEWGWVAAAPRAVPVSADELLESTVAP
jgi:hypothetical protein